ncbi:MAG: alpha-(1-_3)-arabinofuranosyltransferase family protein, partial [Acidimicrobiia bacterium]
MSTHTTAGDNCSRSGPHPILMPNWLRATLGYVVLAAVAYVPVLRSDPGKVAADTKSYLYLDPARLLGRAFSMWDPNVAMGTVTHQTIGYVFPMGPYYWLCEVMGLPDWVAQRLWLGSLMFAAGCGMLYLLRTFGLRGPGIVIAAFAYMLSPYSLDYSARISVLLMPWAALPWMVGLVRKALRDGGWRYPALFAIVVQVVGGVNATALLFAGLGPALWVAYSWLVARDVQWRRAVGVTVKTGVLTFVTSLWWIAGLSIQGGYGLNVLRYTETVEAVARTSTPNEVLRGLGYWFFYGQDRLGPWIEAAENYTQSLFVILAGYALVALALLSAGFVRWKHRSFFVGLLLVGVVIAVGAHPYDSPTPLGSVFKSFATSSTVGLALRSTARAVPLVALATSVLLGIGVNAVYRALRANARPVLASLSVIAVGALIVANFPALVDGSYYGENLQRPEAIPQYWDDAAAALDARDHDTRVLELPGSDFASYRWGNTVDPITPGLMDRPYVARELIPFGGAGTADLLNALDRRIQDGLFDPAGFAALARRLGVGDVVLRNDLQYERYDLISPRELARDFAAVPGLGDPTGFGDPTASLPTRPSENPTTLAAPAGEAPPPPVVVYPVDEPVSIVRAESQHQALMVAGDGEGLIDVANVGLLDGAGVVQYSASYEEPDELRDAIANDTTLVVTDSNRRRARRWTSVRDAAGVTEQPDEDPLVDDPGDARLEVFPSDDPATQSTMDQQGVAWATATHYGNTITYRPEDAAARAFDGDVRTAWRAAAYGPGIGQRIHLALDAPITTGSVNLVQPLLDARDRFITEVVLRFDGGDEVEALLGASSRTAEGQTVAFPEREFQTLEIEITDLNVGSVQLHGNANGVGFAEVRVRDAGADADV